jgi:hypothetical protein
MNQPKRRCARCDTPLPAGSRATRVFCSTSCRVRDWDRRNRPAEPDQRLRRLYSSLNPKHYHVQHGMTVLVGHRDNEPWFGDSCPPQCPGLSEGETFAPMEEFWRQPKGARRLARSRPGAG